MFNRLEAIEKKYEELKIELTNPETLNNFNKLKELSKEESELKEIVEKYEEYKKVKSNLEQAKEMENDPELKEIAISEIETLSKEEKRIYSELEIVEQQVETKLIFLLEIYLECIVTMQKKITGK